MKVMVENKIEKPKADYEKPLFKEAKGLLFPKEIWEKFNGGRWCIQCAGCHACR